MSSMVVIVVVVVLIILVAVRSVSAVRVIVCRIVLSVDQVQLEHSNVDS